jgi:hypothetical protein
MPGVNRVQHEGMANRHTLVVEVTAILFSKRDGLGWEESKAISDRRSWDISTEDILRQFDGSGKLCQCGSAPSFECVFSANLPLYPE